MKRGKNAEILNQVHHKQLELLKTYAFQRITDPAVTAITPDSLRRALNQHEVTGVDDDVLAAMMQMGGDPDQIAAEEFGALFEGLKFKIDRDGRI